MRRFWIAIAASLFLGSDGVRANRGAGCFNCGLLGRLLVHRRKPVRQGPQTADSVAYQ